MKITVRFASLVGEFRTVKTETFPSLTVATLEIENYAHAAGYTNVRAIDDSDGYRFTAKTPAGRSGRNVAFADFDCPPDEPEAY